MFVFTTDSARCPRPWWCTRASEKCADTELTGRRTAKAWIGCNITNISLPVLFPVKQMEVGGVCTFPSLHVRNQPAGSSRSDVSITVRWTWDGLQIQPWSYPADGVNSVMGRVRAFISYLHHFPLWTFRKDQDLVVKRVQRLPDGLGLLLGHADPVFQEVNFDVGRWNGSRQKSRTLVALQHFWHLQVGAAWQIQSEVRTKLEDGSESNITSPGQTFLTSNALPQHHRH